jgi:putative endonuclease
MHFVYILQCSDGSYYTGYTTDIQRRLREHNDGLGSKITRSKLPVVLIHQESYRTKSEALTREAQIKSWSRAKKEALIKMTTEYGAGRVNSAL